MEKQEIKDELYKIIRYLEQEAGEIEGTYYETVLLNAVLPLEELHDEIAESE